MNKLQKIEVLNQEFLRLSIENRKILDRMRKINIEIKKILNENEPINL